MAAAAFQAAFLFLRISGRRRTVFSVKHYERRPPHWDAVGDPPFVTFRLHGSLPPNRIFPPEELATSGKAFAAMDRLLDKGASGPLFLKRPEIAELVVSALKDGEGKLHRYELHA